MENKPSQFEILRTNTNSKVVDFLEQKLSEYIATQIANSDEYSEEELELIDLLYETAISGELISEQVTTLVSEIDGRFFGYSVYFEEFNSEMLLELMASKGIKEIFKP